MTYHLTRKGAYLDTNIVIDAAFPTKLGRPLLASDEVKALVEARMRYVTKTHGAAILSLDLADDHIRLRLSVPPHIAPLALITHLKTDSARAINVNFPDIKRKVSSVWSWHARIRSVGNNTSAGTVSEYLQRTKGQHVNEAN